MADINSLKNIYTTGNADQRALALIELLGLAGIDKRYAEVFVDNNINYLSNEIYSYGFTLNNYFIKFISLVYKERPEVKELILQAENYATVHNAVAREIVKPIEIAGTSTEKSQAKLFFNPYFYNTIKGQGDRTWVLQLWKWCAEDNSMNLIKHTGFKWVLTKPTINVADLHNKYSREKPNKSFAQYLLDYMDVGSKNKILPIERLRRIFIYTDLTQKIVDSVDSIMDDVSAGLNSESLEEMQNKFKSLNDLIDEIDKVNFVSGRLVSPEEMNQSVKLVSTDVQLSDRHIVTGRKQKQEGEEGEENKDIQRYQDNSSSNITTKREAYSTLSRIGFDTSKLNNLRPSEFNDAIDALKYLIKWR